METENLGVGELWQLLAVIDVGVIFTVGWSVEFTRWRELVSILKNCLTIVIFQDNLECSLIKSFSDTTTIITLAGKILEGIEWCLLRVLIQENGQLLD